MSTSMAPRYSNGDALLELPAFRIRG